MTYATKSSLHVKIPKPHNALPTRRRIVLNALTAGFTAVVVGFIAVATVIMAAGWLLAVSLEARADIRSIVVAPRSGRLAWTGPAAGETIALSSETPAPDAIFALAAVVPDSSKIPDYPPVDQIITNSVAAYSFKVAAPDVASAGRPGGPSAIDGAPPPPLPRTPRLAALPPIEDPGNKPEEDDRSRRTAIYDITAKIVYLPSGERLEAHSGFGSFMDDPRFVSRKNRGATPPNTYELKLRESLFHGVQAIRLTPVGDGDMFGRDGILAHSYMLGPSGQSNGCVSFRDYAKFLRAFLRGEIDRIVVVTRLAKPPASFAKPNVPSATSRSL